MKIAVANCNSYFFIGFSICISVITVFINKLVIIVDYIHKLLTVYNVDIVYNYPLRLFFKHHLINLTTELGIHFRPPFLKNKYLKARHNVGLQKPSCRNVVAVYAVFVFIGNLRAKLFCTVINIRIYVACFGRVTLQIQLL